MACYRAPDLHRPLHEVVAAADCFAAVSEVILNLETAREPAALISHLRDGTLLLGADVAFFVSFISDRDCQSFRYLLACDPQWCVDYEQAAWFADDPWLGYARRHSEPIRASEIECATESQRAVVRLAARFGFGSAAVVPAPSSGGLSRLGVLCLGSHRPDYFEGAGFARFKILARPFAAALLEGSIRSTREEVMRLWQLSERELQLLECQRIGMGTKQIATALAISQQAVNSTFQRLNRKLGVLRRTEAATLAAEYGLI